MCRIYFLLITILIGCSSDSSFSDEDQIAIDNIRRDYGNGWLANDSETILNLFSKDATIVPSGLNPISGIVSIESYWFPNDSSETIINSYSIELLKLSGSDSIAYTLEKGTLNFTYTKGDFTMTKESTSHATTIYKKNETGNWKITSRMWTTLKN